MNKLNTLGLAALLAIAAQTANASVNVSFIESAPKDRFVVTNTSQCALQGLQVTIDLTDSVGGLIFDTTATGAGVEVFQPFEVRSGDIKLNAVADVKDGDTSLSVLIANIAPNDSVSFTIDVDDTMRNSSLGMIRVTGAEIENGTVTVMGANSMASTGRFGSNSRADIDFSSCV